MYASDIFVQNCSNRSQSIYLTCDYFSTANINVCFVFVYFLVCSSHLKTRIINQAQNAESKTVFPEYLEEIRSAVQKSLTTHSEACEWYDCNSQCI